MRRPVHRSVPAFFAIVAAIVFFAAVPARIHAQTTTAPAISAALAPKLGELRTLTDARDYHAALALIAEVEPTTGADSYDRFLLLQIRAQILLTQGDHAAALAPLSASFSLGERAGFLAPEARRELLKNLAQLHAHQAGEATASEARRAGYERALDFARRWIAALPSPTADAHAFTAGLLYSLALADNENPDPARLREARAEARAGLTLAVDPPDQLLLIILASHQYLDEHAAAAELLELLVARHPSNKTYWQQLFATYLNLAADTASSTEAAPDAARPHLLRALVTRDRAQAHGALGSATDLQNAISIFFNLGHPDRAAALLDAGLREGTLADTRRNWELLASAHHQQGDLAAAIDTLTRATERHPTEGQLELTLAQHHQSIDRTGDAYRHALAAIEKGNLDQPGVARTYLAWLAFELGRPDDAARHLDDAATFADARPEDLARLRAALTATPAT